MEIGRRQFLLAGFAAAQESATPLLDRGFARVIRLAPGVYATIADPSKGSQCGSNGGIIAGRSAVLIVEGHMRPAGAALEIEAAGMVSKAPIRGAVNTHFHYDHTFGNESYAARQILVLAHEQVGPLMREQYAAVKGAVRAPLLAKYKGDDLEFAKRMYDAIDATDIVYPTEPLPSTKFPVRIDLGGLTALLEFHPGHTTTDLIVRVPEHGVVFAGDLLFHRSYPVAVDANMPSWRKVLDMFAALGAGTRFVPGHGPVCGQDTVRDQCAVFDHLREHAEKMMRAGGGAEEAGRSYIVPERFRDYRISGHAFRVGAAMRSYYSEFQRTP